MKNLCPNCRKPSKRHPIYGVVLCRDCQKKQHQRVSKQIEFTSESIKEQRKQFSGDIEGLHRKGYLNKTWLDRYGAAKAKERGFKDEEIAKAKYVYSDNFYYDENK